MSDIVERLEAELQEIGGCHDRDCKVYVTPGVHTNGGCRCLRDAYTGQRVFRAYRRAVDDQAAAITRLRSLVDAARGVVGALLANHVQLVSCGDCGNWDVETEPEVIAARSLLTKLEGA